MCVCVCVCVNCLHITGGNLESLFPEITIYVYIYIYIHTFVSFLNIPLNTFFTFPK